MKAPDERRIRSMFDGLVERYDLLNDVLSLGLDRWWRRRTAAELQIRSRDRVLDLGCGTGRLGVLLADQHAVTGVDVSGAMLREASRRCAGRVGLVQGSAFRLPFADGSFGGAVSAFVLRNLDNLPVAFGELARVVSPGGRISFVDITEPSNLLVRKLFDPYFWALAPAFGALVGKRPEYRYLVRSLTNLPSSDQLCAMLQRAGFTECRTHALTGGIVTLVSATREARRAQ